MESLPSVVNVLVNKGGFREALANKTADLPGPDIRMVRNLGDGF
jgi:hypothetical protein